VDEKGWFVRKKTVFLLVLEIEVREWVLSSTGCQVHLSFSPRYAAAFSSLTSSPPVFAILTYYYAWV